MLMPTLLLIEGDNLNNPDKVDTTLQWLRIKSLIMLNKIRTDEAMYQLQIG